MPILLKIKTESDITVTHITLIYDITAQPLQICVQISEIIFSLLNVYSLLNKKTVSDPVRIRGQQEESRWMTGGQE